MCGALGQILKIGQTNFLLSLRGIISGSILHKNPSALAARGQQNTTSCWDDT